jgi:Carbohydrate esterase, sialic acid-specific acetylesterase
VKNKPTLLAGLLAAAALAVPARGDVRLPKIISDHMVLQRGAAVPVWGWADPDEEVTVSVAGQTKTAKAGADGKWSAKLDRLEAAGPHTLTVKGKNTLTVNDVLVGEVWLASGQSNMGMTVDRARDFDKEQEAAKLPQLRMFNVGHKPAREPQSDCTGSWQVCSPETVGSFSATAYFFGRDLHQKLAVPVGMINSSVGGTPIEAWTSMDVQAARPELKALLASWDKKAAEYDPEKAKAKYQKDLAAWKEAAEKARLEGKTPPRRPQAPVRPEDDSHHPAVLFNGMIAPLIPYAIKGAVWYQGESNAGNEEPGKLYGVQLPLLVHDWRARWGEGDFPFAWVQLPNYQGPRGWPYVREAMLQALSLPNTGMTVNIDIGEAHDIHPKNKQEVGRRLALWARAEVYGEKVPWSGPLPVGKEVNGDTVELTFQHADGGLKAPGGELRGFTVAGADGKWHAARARIEGDKVLVSSPEVKEPVAVRYDWASDPDGNLYNGAGLPASPFRTDKD